MNLYNYGFAHSPKTVFSTSKWEDSLYTDTYFNSLETIACPYEIRLLKVAAGYAYFRAEKLILYFLKSVQKRNQEHVLLKNAIITSSAIQFGFKTDFDTNIVEINPKDILTVLNFFEKNDFEKELLGLYKRHLDCLLNSIIQIHSQKAKKSKGKSLNLLCSLKNVLSKIESYKKRKAYIYGDSSTECRNPSVYHLKVARRFCKKTREDIH
nr:hypothetical protein [Bacteroidales bacterium]